MYSLYIWGLLIVTRSNLSKRVLKTFATLQKALQAILQAFTIKKNSLSAVTRPPQANLITGVGCAYAGPTRSCCVCSEG